MNRAIRTTATALGLSAAIAGVEHGYFEILQGSTRPAGLMIVSIGPPCQPDARWNGCEPAMTIVPDFLLTGLLATTISLAMILWAVTCLTHRHGGLVFSLLSAGLLLFGGGLFPPLIGIVAGILAGRINRPLTWTRTHFTGSTTSLLARLYPEALVAYLVTVFGQFVIGHYFNDLLLRYMVVNLLFILGFLLLSVASAFAADVYRQTQPAEPRLMDG